MAKHELKAWPEYFDAVFERRKPFEVRKNDRDFKVGDIIVLRRFDPDKNKYTGGICGREITYLMEGGKFGIDPDYVVLGLD
jgi:hypothetical protein